MSDIATLSNILFPTEKDLIRVNHPEINLTDPIVNLTAWQLSKIFRFIDLNAMQNGLCPNGFTVSLVWDELSNRAIGNEFDIRP